VKLIPKGYRLLLGRQIALACMAVSLLAVALVSIAYMSLNGRHARDELQAKAVLYAGQLRRQLIPVIAFSDAATAREIFEALALDPDVTGLAVYAASGEAIEGVGNYPAHITREEPLDKAALAPVIVTAAVPSREGVTGQLYVGLTDVRISRAQLQMSWISCGTGAVALLIAMGLAFPIAKRLTRRLSSIVDTATLIARGDFSEQPMDAGTHDEIGDLAYAVNAMSVDLRRMFCELGDMHNARHERDLAEHALLESRVRERTATLQESQSEAKKLADRFALAAAAAGLGVWEWNLPDNALQWDDQMYHLYDRTRSAAVTFDSWAMSMQRDDRLRVQREIELALNHTAPLDTEFRIVLHDGEVRHLKAAAQVLRDSSGASVRMVGVSFDITKRKTLESQLAEAAQRDKLTGLANRAVFTERLETAIARVRDGEQRLFAVLYLDFDRFKLVNDTLGHKTGDELLRQIARRLQRELRALDARQGDDTSNVVSRFGGDEFLILINDLKSARDATRIAERLLNSLAPSYIINSIELHSSASIGIVTSEQGALSAEDVVRNADVAMYEAKRSGRACSVVFNESMHAKLARHVTIEASLRRAIGSDELFLVYQPIVDLATGKMVSAEALVRWNHPSMGVVTPAEFIPVAEESGLIVALGQWVQAEACRALVRWRTQDPENAPKSISVNVSRAELTLGRQLLDQLSSMLQRVGLPAQCLQLEVTEREVMRDPQAFQKFMHELQALGISIAMDDFGTGTSSLGYLRSYPFNTIKIDQSFVKGLGSSREVLALNHAIINLVENLGMASLAEGVEEPAQVAILQSLGCRFGQGHLFSRPVTEDKLLGAVSASIQA
jgi:diguanylate cyclase (GGDEF)-like protein